MIERLHFGRSTLPSSPGGPWEPCPHLQNQWDGVKGAGASLLRATFPLFCSTDFHCVIQFSCQYKPPYTYCISPVTWQLPSIRWNNSSFSNTSSSFLPPSLQAGEQTPSLLPRAPPEQKGRRSTLRQRNILADYQEIFFFPYKTMRRQFWCLPGELSRAALVAWEISGCVQERGMGRVKKKCV